MDCLFCQIIQGQIPSYKIFEDEQIIVILDIHPSTNGDSLVIPKEHYENIMDMPEPLLNHINHITKEIYLLFQQKLQCDGLTICQNNDYGQDIKHYHLHLTPRYKNDELNHHFNKKILLDVPQIYQQIKED
jgi:histidine triad (HIT) family protein